LQRVAGVSERALLRLGWVLGEKKQWDASRQAYEQLLGRFGGSALRHEARYGIGWALQNQKRYDEAVGQYAQATNGSEARPAAKAQYNVGVCRMQQKRYKEAAAAFQVVPTKYKDAEWGAKALLEAARALQEDKQREQAVKLLRRVMSDHSGSEHAEVARKRLKELGES
jgi:TolA-binding protein